MDKRRGGSGKGLTRRQFVKGAAAVAGGIALPGCGDDTPQVASGSMASALPRPQDAGFDHVVVVMMENRSFDHFLGWVPGADGRQAGVKQVDRDGVERESFDL